MSADSSARILIIDDDSQILFHVGMTLEEMERQMLFKTLAYFNNHKPKAAQTLGISLKTVYNHLAKFGYGETTAAVVDGQNSCTA